MDSGNDDRSIGLLCYRVAEDATVAALRTGAIRASAMRARGVAIVSWLA